MAASVAAVIVAAGRGLRAGGDLPKQYRQVLGEPAIRSSLIALAGHASISLVQPVIHPDDAALFRAASGGLALLPAVPGGASRQASVRAGLEAVQSHHPELVLVHDAARPFASHALITRAIAAGRASGARSNEMEFAARPGRAKPRCDVVFRIESVWQARSQPWSWQRAAGCARAGICPSNTGMS